MEGTSTRLLLKVFWLRLLRLLEADNQKIRIQIPFALLPVDISVREYFTKYVNFMESAFVALLEILVTSVTSNIGAGAAMAKKICMS